MNTVGLDDLFKCFKALWVPHWIKRFGQMLCWVICLVALIYIYIYGEREREREIDQDDQINWSNDLFKWFDRMMIWLKLLTWLLNQISLIHDLVMAYKQTRRHAWDNRTGYGRARIKCSSTFWSSEIGSGNWRPEKEHARPLWDALIFDIFGRHRLGANVFLTLAAKYSSEYVRIQPSTCINKTTYYPNLPKYLAYPSKVDSHTPHPNIYAYLRAKGKTNARGLTQAQHLHTHTHTHAIVFFCGTYYRPITAHYRPPPSITAHHRPTITAHYQSLPPITANIAW